MELQVKLKQLDWGFLEHYVQLMKKNRLALKPAGLTRDARMVERKKPGQKKAKKEIPILKTLIFFLGLFTNYYKIARYVLA